MTFISSTELLSSSSQGDTSSCQSFLCKPQNTGWPLTPAKGVKSLLLTPLHNGDTKAHLRPTCCFFVVVFLNLSLIFIVVSSYSFRTVTLMIIHTHHTTARKVSHEHLFVFAVLTNTSVCRSKNPLTAISLCRPLADIILKRWIALIFLNFEKLASKCSKALFYLSVGFI